MTARIWCRLRRRQAPGVREGQRRIVAPSKDKLPTVIDTLIAAVRAGELDELFSQAAKTGTIGKTRNAA